ncbi:DUF4190 domain-containing protein [Stackebrandtia nassauensis]|uniref:DUF4190 domain-containing protein n=1 Tax=Stackebrandtia nassauensis (strain DSM 44728 / CIP 108903 / NRRL B-16338 / NBRC 102104 / LLR-40K-21) TaxID=446470 RepID=D3Q204_STANL|nr:DUF4190 domain-containing protein [Stackebrandtia nassauensis]ADD41871.1 hypothetical protein Snas_2179 [Stackebrandtia nassauensis DSM 44728]
MTYDPKNPHYDPYTAPPVYDNQPVTGGGYPDGGYPDSPQQQGGYDQYAYQQQPPGPAYNAAGYSPPPMQMYQAPENGSGTAALVLGILGLVGCGLCAIPAVICGHMGMKKADQGLADNRGQAQAGLIMGYIGVAFLVLALLYVVFMLVMFGALASSSTTSY